MAIGSFTRIATEDDSGQTVRKYVHKNKDTGVVSVRTQILEDSVVKSISSTTITNITNNLMLKVEQLSISSNGQVNYTTANDYLGSSLSVYLNGLQIAANVTESSSNTFKLHDDYIPIIETSDTLVVAYVKDEIS